MSFEVLESSKYYQDWLSCTQSCLLFLSGVTELEGRNARGYTHSWLSPAATCITKEMRNQGQKVAYYCCHPDVSAERHASKDVIATMVYQILEWKPKLLRHKYQQFQKIVQREEWQVGDNRKVVEDLFQMMHEVLGEVKDFGTIFIVLDRVDLCDWELGRGMSELVKLVLDDLMKVKIMVVHNPTFGKMWDTDEVDEKAPGRVMVHQEWNQRRLTPLEMQRAHSAY